MGNSKTQFNIWITVAILLASGALLGLSTNLAKIASQQEMEAIPYLSWSLTGALLILVTMAVATKQRPPLSIKAIQYYFISALFTVAGSNLILFSAVSYVGVSFVALSLTLPPLLTYLGALLLGIEKFCNWRAWGIGFAFLGTALMVVMKWSAPDTHVGWLLLTLLGPVFLAAGNIYRTTHWPVGAAPQSLAPGLMMAATVSLFIFGHSLPGTDMSLPAGASNLAMVALQAVVFALQFALLFVLQKRSGPVLLSLMGAISAMFAIPFAVLLLGETAHAALIPSASLILLGIACMIKPQLKLN